MKHSFEVIVVGAGPAGTTAALILARHGVKVALLERGEYPGAKNMFGGAMYGRVLHEIIPEYWSQAPVERYLGRKMFSLLAGEAALSLDFETSVFKQPPFNGFVIQRSKFDRWYAQEAVRAGALLLTQTRVDDLLWQHGQAAGVKVGSDELYAKIVIAADGAMSLLAKKAGLRAELKPEQFSLGVKEVIQLPPHVLEERLRLSGDEGLSNEYLGQLGRGLQGGGFLYTNKDSLSIGVVAQVHSLKESGTTIYEALANFKRHPVIAPLMADGRFLEYSAHLIPEAGVKMLPRLSSGGIMVAGDAAGLVLVGGVFLEGVNFAIASGQMAAETAISALGQGDFSAKTLAEYAERLNGSFVLRDLNRYKQVADLMLNKRLYEVYPSLLCRTLENWFAVSSKGHSKLAGVIRQYLLEEVGLWQLAKDGYQLGRGMVW